ncbi:MAG TPA: sigma-70 family RNA polymerase sigma factor, partial [Steroidobacteraceae bacterium]|nr:sigma-70 family RNA polymerase sigma factor [Steroidobacteraceae bacterium]
DFYLAEEIVQEAFAAAVSRWPTEGTPSDPVAWLITVARNKAVDAIRRRIKLREILASEVAEEESVELSAMPDDRLRLIYTCCHPALSLDAQIALTLRTLGGLTTEEIARAFLTSTVTMAQRLVRAKAKITQARIPYRVPEPDELTERTAAVMSVVYLIFNEGYAATAGDAWVRRDLCHEAIRLGRLMVELTRLPEAQGLLALMLLHDSRRDARTDTNGDLVLLEHQDRSRWDRSQIDEALALVPLALRGGAGPYALQAAIAALHASAARSEDTDWPQIVALFAELLRKESTPVIELNYAVAVAMNRGPEAGLRLLEPLREQLHDYHLWHAARADLLRRLDRTSEAADAYRAALGCVGSEPERRFLEKRLRELNAAPL